jgi:membrane protein YqaA with SNARE-associated domain
MLLVVLWALAEATLFFIVADVPISVIGLRHGWRRAWAAALLAAPAAAAGGVALAWQASLHPHAVYRALLAIPGIGPHLLAQAGGVYAQDGVNAMLAGSFSGVPYKLYAYAAGMRQTGLAMFFLASIAARLPRFILVASISSVLGAVLRPRLRPFQISALFAAFWILFYAIYFAAMAAS